MPVEPRSLARLWSPWRMAYIESGTAPAARRGRRRAPAGAAPAARRGRRRAPAGAAPTEKTPEPPCLFCRLGVPGKDRGGLVLARRPRAFLMLNRYPYNPGHLMAAVVAHKAQFSDLAPLESRDLLDLIAIAEGALAAEYRPHGVNYGVNVGRVAGAGFPGHLHLHLVPRWDGDTNFMPVVGETRVLPESLDRTWERLRRAVRSVERERGRGSGGARR